MMLIDFLQLALEAALGNVSESGVTVTGPVFMFIAAKRNPRN